MDSVFQRQIHLVTSNEPDLQESLEEESSEENSDLDNLGKELEMLLEDKEDNEIVNSLKKFAKETVKTNSTYVPKLKKKTEEEERELQLTMFEIKVKNELKEQGIDPNSVEGKRILSEKIGSTSSLTHDTIWIKLTKREENADGTFKQGKLLKQ